MPLYADGKRAQLAMKASFTCQRCQFHKVTFFAKRCLFLAEFSRQLHTFGPDYSCAFAILPPGFRMSYGRAHIHAIQLSNTGLETDQYAETQRTKGVTNMPTRAVGNSSTTPPEVKDIPPTVGARIKQLREENQLSVKDVATYCGRSTQMVHAWERSNNRNIRTLNFIRLCQVLNARPEYLLFGELPSRAKHPEPTLNMSVLNSSESPDMANVTRSLEGLELTETLLRELGVLEPKRAAWYFMESDRHSPEWKAGDAFIVDRTEKPYKKGFWYLVVLGDRLDMRQVVGGDDHHLDLMDGGGKRAKRATDAVLYVGEIVTSFRRPVSTWLGKRIEAVAHALALV